MVTKKLICKTVVNATKRFTHVTLKIVKIHHNNKQYKYTTKKKKLYKQKTKTKKQKTNNKNKPQTTRVAA